MKDSERIREVEITQEMKKAYLDYAMSVIVARALPDVKDGLKPVQRRILYVMYKIGLTSGAHFAKSSRVVGEVLGKYHPHGDQPVYEALVRMAQDFSMRYPLVWGQGNFGSVDGDPPAAMRYTEVKLKKIAEELLVDIEKSTVIFEKNFDGTLTEPKYLPAKLPNLLLMGAEGIAVGMATKIPPHNLNEIVDALIYLIDNAQKDEEKKVRFEATTEELMKFVKGPDFPTGGLLFGKEDIKQIYSTGRGKVIVRAKIEEEETKKGRTRIVIKELPYQVNKANLVKKIAELITSKRIVGISDLRDESDREGMRVVIELKKDASYNKILNNLYKYTQIQTSFPANMVALVDGVPQTLNLKQILDLYLYHRIDVITRRTRFELEQAQARAHILEGLLIALENIDEIVEIIKKSKNEQIAKKALIERFKLSPIQAQAILDMQLKRLTGLERLKLEEELKALRKKIAELKALLADVLKILAVIKKELIELKEKYGDERRTKIIPYKVGEITDEELIENKEMIIVLTKQGYIKSVPRGTFKVQNRGGKGVKGMSTKEQDNVALITTAFTHDFAFFFTDEGRIFKKRVWEIPQGTRTSKGKAIVNLLSLHPGEKVTSLLIHKEEEEKNKYVLMITQKGVVKKTSFSEFVNIRSNGIIAIRLKEGDKLLLSTITSGDENVIMISSNGKAIVFKEKEIRPMGRAAKGVRGMKLENDTIIAADTFSDKEFKKSLLIITEKGIGKQTLLSLYRGQHRGGKGIKTSSIDSKTGKIAFAQIIEDDDKTAVITSKSGQVVKIPLKSIPKRSRTAKGVILMRFNNKEDVVTSATLIK